MDLGSGPTPDPPALMSSNGGTCGVDIYYISIIIGSKDNLLVIAARKIVIKYTFIFNSPRTACCAIA